MKKHLLLYILILFILIISEVVYSIDTNINNNGNIIKNNSHMDKLNSTYSTSSLDLNTRQVDDISSNNTTINDKSTNNTISNNSTVTNTTITLYPDEYDTGDCDIEINEECFPLMNYKEYCVVDKDAPFPKERGIGISNCRSGLTCFNSKCELPSKEGQFCILDYFNEEGYDKSNCTADFYCDPETRTCQRTVELDERCDENYQCVSVDNPNSICDDHRCKIKSDSHIDVSTIIILFCNMINIYYIYITFKQKRETEENNRNNHMINGIREEDQLPPYTPPTDEVLINMLNEQDNIENNNRRSDNHTTIDTTDTTTTRQDGTDENLLLSPPSYHELPTYPEIITLTSSSRSVASSIQNSITNQSADGNISIMDVNQRPNTPTSSRQILIDSNSNPDVTILHSQSENPIMDTTMTTTTTTPSQNNYTTLHTLTHSSSIDLTEIPSTPPPSYSVEPVLPDTTISPPNLV